MIVRIEIDYENNAEAWWTAARENIATCPPATQSLIAGNSDSLTVSSDACAEFVCWARKLPGFHSGPEYAINPFTVHQVW